MDRKQTGRQKGKDKLTIAALLVLVCVFCFSGYQVITQLNSYREAEQEYASLEEFISIEPPAISPEAGELPAEEEEAAQPSSEQGEEQKNSGTGTKAQKAVMLPNVTEPPVIDFDALQKINRDIVGWIYIGGTQISYPVVRGADNQVYLNRTFKGVHNSAGSIFMDYRNEKDFSSANTILYGHNMKNKTMFAQLLKYKSSDFYNQHKDVWVMTPEGSYRYEIFAAYVCQVDESIYKVNFKDGQFAAYVDLVKGLAAYGTTAQVDASSRILTLSTCTNAEDTERYVVQAKYQP